MPLLATHNLKKTFVLRLLFDEVSFEIGERDKIGLIGPNGCGKTTLLRIITGEESVDSGGVYKNRETRIVSMNQTVLDTERTVFGATLSAFANLLDIESELERTVSNMHTADEAALPSLVMRQHTLTERYENGGGYTFRAKTRATLMGLGFAEAELDKPLNEMSGGQRNKAQLASVLLSGANLLLLDEPTNHLDIESIAWLEDFLRQYENAFIVVSHDRAFLDAVTNRTMELKNTHFYVSNGNYSRHTELQASKQETLRRQYNRTQKEISRIEGIIAQQKRWNQERNYVTIASKQKQIDRLKATLVPPEKEASGIHFHFRAAGGYGNDVLIGENLSKSYEKLIFSGVNFHIRKGERVFLLGPNGCGKTTLLRILTGKEQADAGTFRLGARVTAGYYEQNMSTLNEENTALEEIHDTYPRMNVSEIRNALGAFLFRGDDVSKEIEKLSGGERARIQLLKLMLSGTNLFLLDEPTNHLDIASREALEDALEEYDGTMLIVTHDRYLIDRFADRILYMEADGLVEYIGGYKEYLEESALRKQRTSCETFDSSETSALDYRAKKERQSAINRAMGELKRAEERIAALEAELAEIHITLSSPAVVSDYVKAGEIDTLARQKQTDIDEAYKSWAEVREKLDGYLQS